MPESVWFNYFFFVCQQRKLKNDDVVVAVLAERTVQFSKVPSCVGSSPAIDTELWLRKTSYTCALSNRRVSGPVRLS